jgi:hypothetical protein
MHAAIMLNGLTRFNTDTYAGATWDRLHRGKPPALMRLGLEAAVHLERAVTVEVDDIAALCEERVSREPTLIEDGARFQNEGRVVCRGAIGPG